MGGIYQPPHVIAGKFSDVSDVYSIVLATKKTAAKKSAKKVADALAKEETEKLKGWRDLASTSLKETRDEKRPSTQKSLTNWLTNQLGVSAEDAGSTFESMWHLSYFKLEKNKVVYSKALLPFLADA